MPKPLRNVEKIFGFEAELLPKVRLGDYNVIKISYRAIDGTVHRYGTVVIPDRLVPEFLVRFD